MLNGIEASLRVTLEQLAHNPNDDFELSPYRILSNKLILSASEAGLPVNALALKGEDDFLDKLASAKPNRVDVELVRLRNNICHGDILEFAQGLDDGSSFFTPECVGHIAMSIANVSFKWAKALGEFRRSVGLCRSGPTPLIPPSIIAAFE